MQPTAAGSPGLKPLTDFPTLVTRPTISCPATQGKVVPPHSLRTVGKSEWKTPQKKISSSTSAGVGSRRSREKGVSGEVADCAAYALVEVMRRIFAPR